jgi:serine/threonine-protein kinase
MAQKTNSLERFWKELKRRKVVHVITVYATIAFVILQLVDIVTDPLRLPESTKALVIVLLCIGFIIAIFVSWVYDITPSGIKKTKPQRAVKEPDQWNHKVSRGWKISTYISLVVLAVLISLNFFNGRNHRSDILKLEKSIAVLPFKILSDEPGKQFLADGMMDAITLHLSKMKDLRVMARTSVEQYRTTTKTVSDIGKELDVRYLLEGSFQKFGNDTKLIVQLIKASDGSHLWANEYNSKWDDVFSLQSEVAQKIASELEVALTPEEIEEMAKKPTENFDAYQAFLRGRYYARQPHFTINDWTMALDGFQEAVDLDSTFALAFAELARAHARLIFLRQDLSESRLEKAKKAAETALRLGSDQPRVHLAIGYYYLYAFRDENQALKHLEIAEKNLPNDYEILVEKAAIIVTKGRWDENIQLLNKALRISPDDASILTDLAEAYWITRRYKECEDACNKAIALSPNSTWPYLFKVFMTFSWKGPNKETRDALRCVNPEDEWYLFSWYFQEIGEGNLQQALHIADTTKSWGTWNKMWTIPRATLLADVYEYKGDSELARKNYTDALKILEKKVAEVPNDPRYRSALGIAYAGLGRKNEAINEGLKAVNMLPVSSDAMYGLGVLEDLAVIYTMVGEFDLALEKLDQLLSIPSWFTPVWINWDIRFAPLRSYPGYLKLLKKYSAYNK